MKKNILLFFLIFILASYAATYGLQAEKLPSPFIIIPEPQSVILLNGQGLEPGLLQHLILKGEFNRPVMGDLLSQLTIGELAGKGTLSLILDKTITSPSSEEGYVMTSYKDRVEVISKGEAGLFYGCQSLEQLLEDARDNKKPVPSCKITDYPVLPYRAIHFDLKHHLDHMNYYYESIDSLAR